MKKLVLSAGLMALFGLLVVPMVVNQTPVVAGEIASGFAVGESIPAFDLKDVTGPWKGDAQVCYR